jgi:hypothetical protein
MATYAGECFCGAVRIEVSGEPEAMGYCHCRSCRSWSCVPVNAFSLWKPDAVKVTAGAEHIGMHQKTPVSQRQYCTKCGGHLMTHHPPLGLTDVYTATLPTLAFKPQRKDCFGCHPEPKVHKGQYGTLCAACHDVVSWKSTRPIHDVGNFSLAGSHDKVACQRCHKDMRPLAGTDGVRRAEQSDTERIRRL